MRENRPPLRQSRRRALLGAMFGIDLRSLALFRVGLGLLLLTDLAWRARDLEAFYTDFGALPRALLRTVWEGRWYLCLHAWSGNAAWQWLLFACAAGAGVLLTVGRWTRGWLRSLPPALLQASTHLTIALETLGPLLAFVPCRRGPQLRMAVVAAFWAFHLLLLGSTLRLGHFPWTCALAWVPFLPPYFWEWTTKRRASAPTVQTGPTPQTASSELRGPQTSPPSRLGNVDVIALLLLLYVTAFNIQSLAPERFRRVFPLAFADWTRLDQMWRMFSPAPPREDGWYVFPATLRDGSLVDLFPVVMQDAPPNPGATVRWAKPAQVSLTFRDERWRKFMMYLRYPVAEAYRPGLAAYLRRRWNRNHAPTASRELAALELVYMLELTAEEPGHAPSAPERVLLYEQHWSADTAGQR